MKLLRLFIINPGLVLEGRSTALLEVSKNLSKSKKKYIELEKLTPPAPMTGGTGSGLSEHVREAYGFLAHNYAAGDEIFLFGFSRGAYTARSVAGLISQAGLL
jgi:uncharacterized protein (DUF2235 family)